MPLLLLHLVAEARPIHLSSLSVLSCLLSLSPRLPSLPSCLLQPAACACSWTSRRRGAIVDIHLFALLSRPPSSFLSSLSPSFLQQSPRGLEFSVSFTLEGISFPSFSCPQLLPFLNSFPAEEKEIEEERTRNSAKIEKKNLLFLFLQALEVCLHIKERKQRSTLCIWIHVSISKVVCLHPDTHIHVCRWYVCVYIELSSACASSIELAG